MAELHEKYAPIMHYSKDELFFPMRVDDMLAYSSLHAKDEETPLVRRGDVTPDLLAGHGKSPHVFVRSVDQGPYLGVDVVKEWSAGALEMVYQWAAETTATWTEDLARKAYSWFSPKTKSATQLFWWNKLLANVIDGAVQSISSDELPRLTLPAITRTDALERYHAQTKTSPGYTYYYRQIKDGAYLCLQYWFFYSYNDWGSAFAGFNDHEGDWEGLLLFFRLDSQGRPQEPPAYITFANHESRLTKPWGHPDVTLVGTHPVGYSGAGSHATYPEATTYTLLKAYGLVDYATGDGPTIDHDDWVHRLDLDDAGWLTRYRGSWGTRYWLRPAQAKPLLQAALAATLTSVLFRQNIPAEIELPGVSAPRGPVDDHRPQSSNPVAWAGVPPP